MVVKYEDWLKKELENPKFRAEYEAVEFEYELSQAVIQVRQSEGLTQKQLAKKAGIKPSDLKKLEYCQAAPSLEILQKIARATGKKLEFVPAKSEL